MKLLAGVSVLLLLAAAPAFAAGEKTGEPPSVTPPADSGALDPVLVDALATCRGLLHNDIPAQQSLLASNGWAPEPQRDTETNYYLATDGTKHYDGAGDGELFATYETYPSRVIVFCQVSITNAERLIPFRGLEHEPGLRGKVYETPKFVTASFEEDAAEPGYFLQVDQAMDSRTFNLQITAVQKVPDAAN